MVFRTQHDSIDQEEVAALLVGLQDLPAIQLASRIDQTAKPVIEAAPLPAMAPRLGNNVLAQFLTADMRAACLGQPTLKRKEEPHAQNSAAVASPQGPITEIPMKNGRYYPLPSTVWQMDTFTGTAICLICGICLLNTPDLIGPHQENHRLQIPDPGGIFSFSCGYYEDGKICSQPFSSLIERNSHWLLMHAFYKQKDDHCPVRTCDQRVPPSDLAEHVVRRHLNGTFNCHICLSHYASVTSLSHHLKNYHKVDTMGLAILRSQLFNPETGLPWSIQNITPTGGSFVNESDSKPPAKRRRVSKK